MSWPKPRGTSGFSRTSGSASGLPRVYALHKPAGVLSSRIAEGGARTVYSLLPPEFQHWFAAGRLDKESEGLLLFCDDSRWAQKLMDPGGVKKVYTVTVKGNPSREALEPIYRGGTILDGRVLKPVPLSRLGKAPRGGTRFEAILSEGVNRQIRRMFANAGFRVRRLIRTRIGTAALTGLAPGEGRELSAEEVEDLFESLHFNRSDATVVPTR